MALCQAQIDLWLAEGQPQAARSWLEMWEKVDTENPYLDEYRMRIEASRGLSRIWNRWTGEIIQ